MGGRDYRYGGAGYRGRSPASSSGYPREFLQALFRRMLRIRRIELAIEREYPKDEMKTPIHLSIGQEGVAVGACAALAVSDRAYSSHRTHGPYLAKGGDLPAMMAELYGKRTGCAGSRGGSMHLFDPEAGFHGSSAIVGGVIPIAAGSALASRGTWVSMAFFGDAAAEEGVTYETLNFAALRKLPVVFVCENNFYSVQTPLWQRQAQPETRVKAEAFGVPARKVDGSNVLDVLEAASEAVARARAGEGPTWIEATVYRWRGHHGAGSDEVAGYRSAGEIESWRQACPVESFAAYLAESGWLSGAERALMEGEIAGEIEAALDSAKRAPFPEPSEVLRHVYAMG